jgi:hypothetical protein
MTEASPRQSLLNGVGEKANARTDPTSSVAPRSTQGKPPAKRRLVRRGAEARRRWRVHRGQRGRDDLVTHTGEAAALSSFHTGHETIASVRPSDLQQLADGRASCNAPWRRADGERDCVRSSGCHRKDTKRARKHAAAVVGAVGARRQVSRQVAPRKGQARVPRGPPSRSHSVVSL